MSGIDSCAKRKRKDALSGGLAFWASVMTGASNKRTSAGSMAQILFGSTEFVGRDLSTEDTVECLYRAFMGRFPGSGEKSYWAGELTSGHQTFDEVLTFFANSAEFTAVLQKYFPGAYLGSLDPATADSLLDAVAAYTGGTLSPDDAITSACVGDVNGDGWEDYLLAASGTGTSSAETSKVYLLLGTDAAPVVGAAFLPEEEGDVAGRDIGPAGDVNGDGLDDLYIGATNTRQPGSVTVKVYLIYGRAEADWGMNFNLSGADGRSAGPLGHGDKGAADTVPAPGP